MLLRCSVLLLASRVACIIIDVKPFPNKFAKNIQTDIHIHYTSPHIQLSTMSVQKEQYAVNGKQYPYIEQSAAAGLAGQKFAIAIGRRLWYNQ